MSIAVYLILLVVIGVLLYGQFNDTLGNALAAFQNTNVNKPAPKQ